MGSFEGDVIRFFVAFRAGSSCYVTFLLDAAVSRDYYSCYVCCDRFEGFRGFLVRW